MAKHPRIAVVLTQEGLEALSGEPFYQLTVTKTGGALNCEKVEERGYFQRLTLSLPPAPTGAYAGKAVTFEIDLPTHYILYVMTAVSDVRKRLGFQDE